jgi:hypothetical protein
MSVHVLTGLAISAFLAACTTHRDHRMEHHHSRMDMAPMCEMHRDATAGKSPAEQQAALEAQVKSMHGTADPAMVAMHRRMMETHCGMGSASTK